MSGLKQQIQQAGSAEACKLLRNEGRDYRHAKPKTERQWDRAVERRSQWLKEHTEFLKAEEKKNQVKLTRKQRKQQRHQAA